VLSPIDFAIDAIEIAAPIWIHVDPHGKTAGAL
jgi:hypothetical protein